MKPRSKTVARPEGDSTEQMVYSVDTPKWRKYYLRVRKTIRFPRYYKKAQNW